MAPVLIALGSNLGDRLDNLQRAVDALAGPLCLKAVSHVYETEPMYVEDQPPYFNAAMLAETDLGPRGLLRLLKETEIQVGRQPRTRYGPREIDLDLISYGSLKLTSRGAERSLDLPHPRVPERRFVLLPAHDVDPELVLANLGTIDDLLKSTNSQSASVVKRDDAVLSIHRHR